MSFFTRQKTSTLHPITSPREHHRPKRSRKDACRTIAAACLAMLVFAGLGWALVAVGTDNEAEAQSFVTCPAGQVPRGQRLDSASECVPCPTTSRTIPSGCDGYTSNSSPPPSSSTTTTTTTRAPADPDPPFEPADIQTSYAQTATRPAGACSVVSPDSQYTTYYKALAANWCSAIRVYKETSGSVPRRLDFLIVGKNRPSALSRAQLINTVATGALTLRIQGGASEITCTASGAGWSVFYYSSIRQILLSRVFGCESRMAPRSSITVNTITKTATATTPTTRAPADSDPPFEPADIQTSYALRTATRPTGACDVAGQSSQFTIYYAELTENWCSVVMVYTTTTGSNRLRLAINIIGKNQTGTIPREQLLKTVAAGAVTMRVQRGTSEITCTASGEGWSNAYFSAPRHIYLGRVFDCQSYITPASSITVNTIAKTATATTPPADSDPPFEPADIQTSYAQTATRPTGACSVVSPNSQYTIYYKELAANWCSVIRVYKAASGNVPRRLDFFIAGKNRSSALSREQLINTVATGALTLRVQGGASEITCTASGEGWSVFYYSSIRQIEVSRVFGCESRIAPTSSITVNTITKTVAPTAPVP